MASLSDTPKAKVKFEIPVIDAKFRKQYKLLPQVPLPDRAARSYPQAWWNRHAQIVMEAESIQICIDNIGMTMAGKTIECSPHWVSMVLGQIENEERDNIEEPAPMEEDEEDDDEETQVFQSPLKRQATVRAEPKTPGPVGESSRPGSPVSVMDKLVTG